MTGAKPQIQLRPFRPDDASSVLGVINSAFDRERTAQWFVWKHLHGPWGPSDGWVIENDGVMVAARLFVPWQLRRGASVLSIHRAMDGAVAPDAQRQGHFSRMIRAEMDLMEEGRRKAVLTYSTSVLASREAYRKLGWHIMDVPHTVELCLPAPHHAAKVIWDDALDYLPGAGHGDQNMVETAWTREAMLWRTAPESGYDYRSARLSSADVGHGLILRSTRLRGVRTVVVVHSWGPSDAVRATVRAVATLSASPLILTTSQPTLKMKRLGTSTVSLWASDRELLRDVVSRARFSFADIEGVM